MTNNDPAYQKTKFVCPFCGAVAQMTWAFHHNEKFSAHRLGQAKCNACDEVSIWRSDLSPTSQMISDLAGKGAIIQVDGTMIYPLKTTAPLASPDLPIECKNDFEEARNLLSASPRGAAALLRLVVQKLCKYFGEEGKNINADISSLVSKGKLPRQVQESLDVVRLVGNSAVHPGEIVVEDNVELVRRLFGLVNYIVQEMITGPNQRAAIFGEMPEKAREAITKRDAPKS